MIKLRGALAVLLCALATACAPAAPPTTSPIPMPTSPPASTSDAPPTIAPTPTAGPTSDGIPYLANAEAPEPGRYRLTKAVLGAAFPQALVTVPAGWSSSTWFVSLDRDGEAMVAVSLWNVAQVYGHPCDWAGTLFDPGPTASDLASALSERPLRNATTPVEVRLAGYAGMYLEWSVPTTIEFSQSGNPAPSEGCDADSGGTAFYSFTGRGDASNRYQQGPGQIDYLWILDIPGGRVVIDAYSMPGATDAEIAEMLEVVGSITFEE